jgi:tRNA(fMet)-specific endonuclease VapC
MNNRIVIDTDVVSFVFKGDTRANLYQKHLNGKDLVISFMSVAELYRWSEEKKWGMQRISTLEEHIRKLVVCPADRNLCKTWGRVMTESKKKGKPIQCADAWIAATAINFGLPLVTHNSNHFSSIEELMVISET